MLFLQINSLFITRNTEDVKINHILYISLAERSRLRPVVFWKKITLI